ncbi:DUF29 domain-containing protein [Thermocrinis sp.]
MNNLKTSLKELYEKDFLLWLEENLKLLREGNYQEVDWENLLEEIEDMGRRHVESAVSYMAVILEHLYKWENFRVSEDMGHSWIDSVEEARLRMMDLIEEYPSIRFKCELELQKAWNRAKRSLISWLTRPANRDFLKIYGGKLPRFPEECPYTFEQVIEYRPWMEESFG